MNHLIIGFRTRDARIDTNSTVMAWGLNHDTIHCELFFQNYADTPRWSSWNDTGVTFRRIDESLGDLGKWKFYDLGTERYHQALYVAQYMQGKKYDLKTAIMSAMGLKSNVENAYFCSEAIYKVLLETGFPIISVNPSEVLPHELEVMLQYYPQVKLNDYNIQ
jgi:hypothetical protein